jgi:hypothetical protein
VGLLALSPAHATLIEHSSTSPRIGGVHEDYGAGIDDTVAAQFLFGDAAPGVPALWRLQRGRADQKADGYLARWVEFSLSERFSDPLTHAGLPGRDASAWRHGALDRWLATSFPGGSRADTGTTSVPEPATLVLLGTGVLGAWATRRRRRTTDL